MNLHLECLKPVVVLQAEVTRLTSCERTQPLECLEDDVSIRYTFNVNVWRCSAAVAGRNNHCYVAPDPYQLQRWIHDEVADEVNHRAT